MKGNALIIQEDVIMKHILKNLLLSKGYTCTALANLMELDLKDMKVPYDVVITDLLFRGISATQNVLQLGEVLLYKKIFVVTGLGQEKTKRSIQSLTDIDGYFEYPIDLAQISRSV